MARRINQTLLSNASATGSSVDFPGGNALFMVEGTIGGATVQVQMQTPNGTWVPVGTGLTAIGSTQISAPAGPMRAAVTGGTPSALYAYIVGIPQNVAG